MVGDTAYRQKRLPCRMYQINALRRTATTNDGSGSVIARTSDGQGSKRICGVRGSMICISIGEIGD